MRTVGADRASTVLRQRAGLAGKTALAATIVFCCAACSSTIELGKRHLEDAGTPRDQLWPALVHAWCDNLQRCCASVGRDLSIAGCAMTVEVEIEPTASNTALKYDPVEAARCVQAVSATTQACTVTGVKQCLAAFSGDLPLGAECSDTHQCANGSDLVICGFDHRCVQPKRGVRGDFCMLTCIDGQGETPTCAGIIGGSATTGAACHLRDGLICSPGPGGIDSCQPPSSYCKLIPTKSCPAGQLCNESSNRCEIPVEVGAECTTSLCVSTAYCNDGVCTTKKPKAAACTTDAECESNLCNRGACGDSLATAGFCGGAVD